MRAFVQTPGIPLKGVFANTIPLRSYEKARKYAEIKERCETPEPEA